MNLDALLAAELAALEKSHLRRQLQAVDDPAATGQVNFSANDYLGLSRHPLLTEASLRATRAHGTGAGASRLITGTTREVLELEQTLAAWKEKEATLVFGSGYAAALGTLPALIGQGDTVILDKLSHASLIDAARLSGATLRIFPHNNLDRLEALLQKTLPTGGRVLIVTESLFSMDGDAAPLRKMVELKERYGAWLLVDEAHATGLYGSTGAGLVNEQGLSDRIEIVMGTFSKALGSIGGYITGSQALIDWLIGRARSFVYSTALPPGAIAANLAAIRVAQSAEGTALRKRLRENIERFQAHLPEGLHTCPGAEGAIQPILCGEAAEALRCAEALRAGGFLIPAIRYPTVPRHAARLRVTLSAAHRREEIDALNGALRLLPLSPPSS